MIPDTPSSPIPVVRAAERLGVHASRIHHMLRDGSLRGVKISGRWWVDPWSLHRREVADAPAGRPFGEANAWALLNLVEGRPVDWVSDSERSRLRRRLRENDLPDLAPRLRRRAAVRRFRVHRGLFDDLAADPALALGGISAAEVYSADILGGREVEGYVGREELPSLLRRHALVADPGGNVLLHVVEQAGRLAVRGRPRDRSRTPGGGETVSPVVVALDLMEAVDARSRRAGRELLERLDDDRTAG